MFSESDAYERFMGRWSRQMAGVFVAFADLPRDAAVLDVGSGTGALTAAVLSAAAPRRVVGADPSTAYVDRARATTDDPRARFEVGDGRRLRFADASFDAALSLLVLNFIPDPRQALAEMIRVTRPGGVVAAAVWDYAEGMEMLRLLWDEAVRLDPGADARDERHMPLSRAGELTDLWRAAGLADVHEAPLLLPLNFASFDDFWRPFLAGQGPAGAYVASLTDPARAALEAGLRRRLPVDSAGAIRLSARAWAVRGLVAA